MENHTTNPELMGRRSFYERGLSHDLVTTAKDEGTRMNTRAALMAYQDVKIEGGITGASSHQLVVMLLEGSIDKLTTAEVAIENGEVAEKGRMISGVISIIDNLRASIDVPKGGEIATNLVSLYDYMEHRLLEANLASDVAIIQEVKALLKEVYEAWLEIPFDLRGQ